MPSQLISLQYCSPIYAEVSQVVSLYLFSPLPNVARAPPITFCLDLTTQVTFSVEGVKNDETHCALYLHHPAQ